MQTEIILTDDGSASLYVPELKEQYHSRNGAVQEAEHVFIKAGLEALSLQEISIFEMGFGTGLNALLSFLRCSKAKLKLKYHCIEKYPLEPDILDQLAYPEFLKLNNEEAALFRKMHSTEWGSGIQFSNEFSFMKLKGMLEEIEMKSGYDLVYFDAFAPEVQPELWTEEIFRKLFQAMNSNGYLVTYCAKGEVRRRLQRCGFTVERLPGPPGKREMLRACKNG